MDFPFRDRHDRVNRRGVTANDGNAFLEGEERGASWQGTI